MLAASRAKTVIGLVFNSNFAPPNLARFQALDPKGGLNFYGSEDATLAKLIAEASVLPVEQSEATWKKAYAHVLAQAGVPLTLRQWGNLNHGFFSYTAISEASAAAADQLCDDLRALMTA